MPAGAVKVMFRVNDPLTDCNWPVLRESVPRLLLPLSAPKPSAVVPVKVLPLKVNCETPVTDPVVEPEMVTSSARASLWARAIKASATRQRKSDLPAVRIPNFSISVPPLNVDTLTLGKGWARERGRGNADSWAFETASRLRLRTG